MEPLIFEVNGLRRVVAQRPIISDISFSLRRGDVLFVRGPSGAGKTLLLRALACLDAFQVWLRSSTHTPRTAMQFLQRGDSASRVVSSQGGTILLEGRTPDELTQPCWRALVSYLPQGRVSIKGTPAELYYQAQRFASQRGRPRGDLPALVHEMGLEQLVLNQPWSELSVSWAQRARRSSCASSCVEGQLAGKR